MQNANGIKKEGAILEYAATYLKVSERCVERAM